MKRLWALFTSLALAVILVLPASAMAHVGTQLDLNYNNFCDQGTGVPVDSFWSAGYVISRSSSQAGGRITGSGGDVVARALWPCVDGGIYGSTFYDAKSLLLVANIQSDPYFDGAYNFIQAGLGKVHYRDGQYECSGAQQMLNDQTYFVYTPSATSNGVFCKAEFVDFNNNGVPDLPVAGVAYRASIDESTVGGSTWRVCFTRVSDLATDCKWIPRGTQNGGVSGANAAWWGCEAGNEETAIGVPQPYARAPMSKFYYIRSDGTKLYTENSTVSVPWRLNPWYWYYAQSQTGLGESLDCYTIAH